MPLRRLQLTLGLTAAAAAVVMSGLLSEPVRLGCLALVLLGSWLCREERLRSGGGWWSLLGAGALLSLAGLALSAFAETAGGIVAIAGSALVIVGATIGFPLD